MTTISEDRQFLSPAMFPDRFDSEDHLEDFMSIPSRALIDDMNKVEGDILILGVAGKMGPTLARLAKRAAPEKRIVGVARFSDAAVKQRLESWGIETHVADLLDRDQVQGIPKLPNIVYMAGKKFGTAGMELFTWAMNTYVPALVGEAFPNSRIVVFSTILVYPSSSIVRQGCTENDPPYAAPGEYANSCVGRERSFEFFSIRNKAPMRGFRLCYSQDMRYGVFHEVATKVFNDQPIDLSAGHVNAIWQGDANSQALRSLLHCTVPMSPINIAGAEVDQYPRSGVIDRPQNGQAADVREHRGRPHLPGQRRPGGGPVRLSGGAVGAHRHLGRRLGVAGDDVVGEADPLRHPRRRLLNRWRWWIRTGRRPTARAGPGAARSTRRWATGFWSSRSTWRW